MAKAAPAKTEKAPAKSNIQKHGTWSAETAQEEYDESQSASGSANILKLKTGKNVLRFLPPRAGEKSPFQVVHQHYIELPGGGGKAAAFNCPRLHKAGFNCPACARAEELRATGNQADYELAGKYLPRRRVFANVVDRADPERGVVILPFGKTVHEQLLSLRGNEEAGGDFTDPSGYGFDVTIERKGEKLNTEYKVFGSRRNSPLGNDDWLDEMHDLSRLARVESEEEILKKLGEEAGSPPPRVSASRGGSSPRGSSGSGKGGRRTAEDDQEDTED